MAHKVSRHRWPTDRAARLALIHANLTIWLPTGPPKWKPKATKDDLEELEEEEQQQSHENSN